MDFASAGGTWDGRSEYCTWLPTCEPPPMGLSWIGTNARQTPKGARELKAWLRRTVEIPAGRKIVKATLLMAAEGRFVCLVNGRKAAQGGQSPAVQTADVTADLKAGVNVLAVEADLSQIQRWAGGIPAPRAGVIGAMRIEFAADAPQVALTDGRWQVSERKEEGWERADFDAASWNRVSTWPWQGTGIAPWNLFDSLPPVGQCPH